MYGSQITYQVSAGTACQSYLLMQGMSNKKHDYIIVLMIIIIIVVIIIIIIIIIVIVIVMTICM